MKSLRLMGECMHVAALGIAFVFSMVGDAQQPQGQPSIRTYKTIGAIELKAHIFFPAENAKGKLRPAMIVLHGGGWNAGSAEWTYYDAGRFAGLGMVAIAGEYRLSNQKDVTPIEAMADTRDLIRWVRRNAADLGIDAHRVAVYGSSAGAHLAASAAVFPHDEENTISAIPDAMILVSPAVSIVNDQWPKMLLLGRAEVRSISPAENISKRLPPAIVIVGDKDTETPLPAVQRFCDRAKQVGGTCELHVYPGVGHLLSRNLDPRAQEQGPFDPDPAAVTAAHGAEDAFLGKIGYIH